MGKYASHEEFGALAPWNWRKKATRESLEKGLSRIAPPGMKPREERLDRFSAKIDFPHSTTWHHNWDRAMFGGTEIESPGSETKQMRIETLFPPEEKPPYS